MAHAPPPPYSQVPTTEQGVIFSPNVPYIGPLPPLCDGFMVTISGRVLPKADKFHVNLSLGSASNEQCETAYHINPRFGDNIVVRNSFLGRSWAAEERDGPGFPLQKDQNFEMIILVTNHSYKTSFNGMHFCDFVHRTPKERVTHLVIEGDIMIHQIKLTDPRNPATLPPPGPPPTFCAGPPVAPGHPGYPPVAPGHPGYPPVAPGHPGYPPSSQGYPAPGIPEKSGYPPALNMAPGYPAAPPSRVLGYPPIHPPPQGYPSGVAASPPSAAGYPPNRPQGYAGPKPSMKLPHLQALRKGVEPGLVIRIHGMPKLDAKEMRFDFLCNNKDVVAFHFNPRFHEKVVVRNSRSGNWGKEERQQPKFPFLQGKEFDMIIYCDPSKYQVTIDGENFISFNHRIRNLANIRFLKIDGNMDLYSIQI